MHAIDTRAALDVGHVYNGERGACGRVPDWTGVGYAWLGEWSVDCPWGEADTHACSVPLVN